jgi:hypothetical protein
MAVVLTERAETGREKQIGPQTVAERPARFGARLGRAMRSIGQVVLFTVFGLYGVLMSTLIMPAYSVVVRDRVRRAHGIRRVMYHTMRIYVGSMRALRLIDLEVNLDRVPAPGSLLVANHPSLIDALVLLGHVEDGVVIAKRSLQVNPFTWGGIRGANYVVNADPQALIEECCARIAAGEDADFVPECTRYRRDGSDRLRRGAAHIAVRSGCPVIPVTIEIFGALVDAEEPLVAGTEGATQSTGGATSRDPSGTVYGWRSQRLACCASIDEHLRELYVRELARRGSA